MEIHTITVQPCSFQISQNWLYMGFRRCSTGNRVYIIFLCNSGTGQKNSLFSLEQGFISGAELINFPPESQIIHFDPYFHKGVHIFFLLFLVWNMVNLSFCSLSSFVKDKRFSYIPICAVSSYPILISTVKSPGGGGGDTPLYGLYRYEWPQTACFFLAIWVINRVCLWTLVLMGMFQRRSYLFIIIKKKKKQ